MCDDRFRFTLCPHANDSKLHDPRADPGECRNLAAAPHYQSTVCRLHDRLRERLLDVYNPILNRVGAC